MDKVVCIKCGYESDNGLPMCTPCREELVDFIAFAKYINGFEGKKDDLLWLIHSEIGRKQASIIGITKGVKVVIDYANEGAMKMVPIEPSDSTVNKKPYLWDRYLHIKEVIDQIDKLYNAADIVSKTYV